MLMEAKLDLRPYRRRARFVAAAPGPSTASVLLAGMHRVSLISLSVTCAVVGSACLMDQWATAEETATEHRQTGRREDRRLSIGWHLVQTRDLAQQDIREGAGRGVTGYTGGTDSGPVPPVPAIEVVVYLVSMAVENGLFRIFDDD